MATVIGVCLAIIALILAVAGVCFSFVMDGIPKAKTVVKEQTNDLTLLSKEDYDFLRDQGLTVTNAVHRHFYPDLVFERAPGMAVVRYSMPTNLWGEKAEKHMAGIRKQEAEAKWAREAARQAHIETMRAAEQRKIQKAMEAPTRVMVPVLSGAIITTDQLDKPVTVIGSKMLIGEEAKRYVEVSRMSRTELLELIAESGIELDRRTGHAQIAYNGK